MSNNIQEIVAIIDRSGSMIGKEEDTIGGINSTFEVIKESLQENETVRVSIKLFDHEEVMLVNSIDIKEIKPIEKHQYQPRGQTALYDAIGNTLSYFIEKKQNNQNAYTKCLIYIVTDGMENTSKNFNSNNLKDLITSAQKNYSIELIYLAANQDAIFEASKMGITPTHALNYSETKESYNSIYRSVASVANRQRSGANTSFTQEERNDSYENASPPLRRPRLNPPPIVRQASNFI